MTIQEKIKAINWTDYEPYSEYYDPKKAMEALLKLSVLENDKENANTYNSVLSSIGNNHAGTYYPVIRGAIGIITEIALDENSEVARNCALEIICDLCFSFEPETGNYNIYSEELENFVQEHIKAFTEEINIESESERNQKLIMELIEYFKKQHKS